MRIELIDTHAHLYLDAFSDDLNEIINRALSNGVTRIFLPNLDSTSLEDMLKLSELYPDICYPMLGLHPTSVNEGSKAELDKLERFIHDDRFIAIGEIGIDLYWDKTYLKEQERVFRMQLQWAKKVNLPVVIHARDSFEEIFRIMDEENSAELKGVFHSFTGNEEQVQKILSYNFYIGINGIVTFKNSGLQDIVRSIPSDKLLIETDAPFLSPHPYRGKRNESSYLIEVASKIAEIYEIELDKVADITSKNALLLFTKAS